MTSCLETGRSWDSSSCSCLCPPSKTCSGGQVLDPSTCGCLLKEIQEGQEQEVEEREERSEGQEDPLALVLKWEYPVILTLASLNLLLVSIIVVLARRHHKLRIRIKKQPRSGRLLILLLFFWYCSFHIVLLFYSWICIIFIFSPQPPTQPLGWQPVLSPPWQGGGRRKGGEIRGLHPAVLQ